MTLDDAIRATARTCTGITLWPTTNGGWQASVRQPDGGYRIGIDPDPVAALRKVLAPDPVADTFDAGVLG